MHMKKFIFLAGVIILFPLFSHAEIQSNLKYGSKGKEVIELQEFLIDQNFLTGSATGNFYALTLRAVKAFQTARSLPSTGYVGILTRNKINSELVIETAPVTQAQIAETGSKLEPISLILQVNNQSQMTEIKQEVTPVSQKAVYFAYPNISSGHISYINGSTTISISEYESLLNPNNDPTWINEGLILNIYPVTDDGITSNKDAVVEITDANHSARISGTGTVGSLQLSTKKVEGGVFNYRLKMVPGTFTVSARDNNGAEGSVSITFK